MSKKLCIWGDSITWGAHDTEYGGWVNRLRLHIESQGIDVNVYNLGISGNTTEDLLKRFRTEAKAREANPIVFAIGINDSRYIRSRENPQISPKKFEENLGELFLQAKKFSELVAFIGITCVDEQKCQPRPRKPDINYDNEIITDYNGVLKAFCIRHDAPFLDMKDVITEADLPDGLHPNAEGHRKMFERIRDFMIPLLRSIPGEG